MHVHVCGGWIPTDRFSVFNHFHQPIGHVMTKNLLKSFEMNRSPKLTLYSDCRMFDRSDRCCGETICRNADK